MQNKKITAQDIADKLNISRNTVSKALNNTGNISEDTKMKVIQTAFEMGYKNFSQENKNITFKKKLHFSPLICQTLHTLVLNFYLDLKKR